jgi:hypothetical protein
MTELPKNVRTDGISRRKIIANIPKNMRSVCAFLLKISNSGSNNIMLSEINSSVNNSFLFLSSQEFKSEQPTFYLQAFILCMLVALCPINEVLLYKQLRFMFTKHMGY